MSGLVTINYTLANDNSNTITKTISEDSLSNPNTLNLYEYFSNAELKQLENIEITGLDTTNITDLSYLFDNRGNYSQAIFDKLKIVNMQNTENIISMNYMFKNSYGAYGRWGGAKLILGNLNSLRYAHNGFFNTYIENSNMYFPNLEDGSGMFYYSTMINSNCNFYFNNMKIQKINNIFYGIEGKDYTNLSIFGTDKIKDFSGSFYDFKNIGNITISMDSAENICKAFTTQIGKSNLSFSRLNLINVGQNGNGVLDLKQAFEQGISFSSEEMNNLFTIINLGQRPNLSHFIPGYAVMPSWMNLDKIKPSDSSELLGSYTKNILPIDKISSNIDYNISYIFYNYSKDNCAFNVNNITINLFGNGQAQHLFYETGVADVHDVIIKEIDNINLAFPQRTMGDMFRAVNNITNVTLDFVKFGGYKNFNNIQEIVIALKQHSEYPIEMRDTEFEKLCFGASTCFSNSGITSLNNINIKNSMIFYGTFAGCNNLVDVPIVNYFNDALVMDSVFQGCPNLSNESLVNIVKSLPNMNQVNNTLVKLFSVID